MTQEESIVTLDELARRLGLSKRWLTQEVRACRIPHLQAGKSRLFNVDAVRQSLAERAKTGAGGSRD